MVLHGQLINMLSIVKLIVHIITASLLPRLVYSPPQGACTSQAHSPTGSSPIGRRPRV
jgi:hypothetical protein